MDYISDRPWDYVVIGTGMGGATVGLALAQQGASVLFLEKGRSHLNDPEALTGNFAETFEAAGTSPGSRQAVLASAGRYRSEIEDISNPDKTRRFTPFIGAGTGGSSALYGMALERFFPADFQPANHHQHAGETTLPAAWPVSYTEMSPYYAAAESLFRVRGRPDPLRPAPAGNYLEPPAISRPNQQLSDFFAGKGLHPYQLPMACKYTEGCLTCQSFLCARGCKQDASTCLQTAITDHNAHLLDRCTVTAIEATDSDVTAVACQRDGEPLRIKAKRYILAAGALETPRLLLSSVSDHWPQGLANRNDQVGRNLMRHYVDLYAIFTTPRPDAAQRIKEIAFNDFYLHKGEKLGSVQSFGLLPPPSVLVNEIAADIRHLAGPAVAGLFAIVKPVTQLILSQIFRRSVLLASTLEDLPFRENRVTVADLPDATGSRPLQITYNIHKAEAARIARMRELMKDALKPMRYLLLKQAESNERLAHVCGTARFGEDPSASVCDTNQRAHGVSNLYIADSSVFPSSGGINPSLTIAALSLRLARHLEANGHA